MPRPGKGAHLWLRPASRDRSGTVERARWIIKDHGHQIGTGCGASDRAEAERKLARYIASKYLPTRRERDLVEIPVADVLNIYLTDAVPGQARPDKAVERAGRLLSGAISLSDVSTVSSSFAVLQRVTKKPQ